MQRQDTQGEKWQWVAHRWKEDRPGKNQHPKCIIPHFVYCHELLEQRDHVKFSELALCPRLPTQLQVVYLSDQGHTQIDLPLSTSQVKTARDNVSLNTTEKNKRSALINILRFVHVHVHVLHLARSIVMNYVRTT